LLGGAADRSADQGRRQRLSSLVAGVGLVPELDLRLAEAPTQQYRTAIHLAGKIDETEPAILQLNAKLLELLLKSVDLAGERLRVTLQLFRTLAGLAGTRGGRDEIQLEDLLAPESMLTHHVLDDLPNEGKRAIRAFDSEEQRHVPEVSA
jgi:hypothetical protein